MDAVQNGSGLSLKNDTFLKLIKEKESLPIRREKRFTCIAALRMENPDEKKWFLAFYPTLHIAAFRLFRLRTYASSTTPPESLRSSSEI
jgi:hypothetical protein